jgi:hypothetical protein
MGCQPETIARRLNCTKKSVLARLRRLGWGADFFGGFKTKDLVVELRVSEQEVTVVISTVMNPLLLYPDRPFGLGTLYGFCTNPESGERERFVIADPPDLDEQFTYAKERRLIEEIRQELAQGRNVQVSPSKRRNET